MGRREKSASASAARAISVSTRPALDQERGVVRPRGDRLAVFRDRFASLTRPRQVASLCNRSGGSPDPGEAVRIACHDTAIGRQGNGEVSGSTVDDAGGIRRFDVPDANHTFVAQGPVFVFEMCGEDDVSVVSERDGRDMSPIEIDLADGLPGIQVPEN